MAVSFETSLRLQHLRNEQQTRELTMEEMKEVILLLRQDRVAASTTVAKNKTTRARKQVAQIDSDDLLSQLGDV